MEILEKIQNKLKVDEAFLITDLKNVRYLTTFSGSNGSCIITNNDAVFYTDSRYTIQSQKQVKNFKIKVLEKSIYDLIKDEIKKEIKTIYLEGNNLTLREFNKLKNILPKVNFFESKIKIEDYRIIKSEKEIEYIKKAANIMDEGFKSIINEIKPGISEKEVAAKLEFLLKIIGGEEIAFETIVASGVRSALPHGIASEKIIKENEFVKIDFGCYYNGYAADMTRTIFLGNEITQKHKNIYYTVLEAQKKAIDFAKENIKAHDLDEVARNYINSKGFGEYFIHSLGHGLGLNVHESPRIGKNNSEILKKNMIITIEPGIYIEGFGGVRIEDDVIIKEKNCEIINKTTKDLIIIKV